MSTTHTPRPWRRIERQRGERHILICDKGGLGIARVVDRTYNAPQDTDLEANVCLIEAAPDLLAACEAVMTGDAYICKKASAAIAKAKPKETTNDTTPAIQHSDG